LADHWNELQKLASLTPRPLEIAVKRFDDSELDTLLGGHPAQAPLCVRVLAFRDDEKPSRQQMLEVIDSFHAGDENLAVADLAGARGDDGGFDRCAAALAQAKAGGAVRGGLQHPVAAARRRSPGAQGPFIAPARVACAIRASSTCL
jgi:hypothetical protein